MGNKRVSVLSLGLTAGAEYGRGYVAWHGAGHSDPLTRGLLAWKDEPAWVVGAVVGTVFFMVGVGSLTDWWKQAKGELTAEHHDPDPDEPGWVKYFGFSLDHKVIGIQYAVASFIMFSFAGLSALIFRTELVQTQLQFLTADQYNTYMSLHGIVMIMSILLGVGAMSNYLVPLLIAPVIWLFHA
jgi:cytochrome c oxidase subunit 1